MVTEKTYRSWCCKLKFLRVVLKNAEPNASQEWRAAAENGQPERQN